MTLWDQIKSTFNSDPDRPDDEKLTAAMWNQHVEDGHFPADKLNARVDGNGYPIWTDPANGDVVVWRYEPGTGIVPAEGLKLATAMDANGNDINNVGALEADKASINNNSAKIINTSINQTLSHDTNERLEYDTIDKEDGQVTSVDLSNNTITVLEDGDYLCILKFRCQTNTDWSMGDGLDTKVEVNGAFSDLDISKRKVGTEVQSFESVWHLDGFSDGDTISATVNQDSGADQFIDALDKANSLSVIRLS